MLQVGLGLPHIASLSQAKGSNTLRERSFHASTKSIALLELWCGLEVSSGLDGGMLLRRTQRELARMGCCCRTQRAARTSQTICEALLNMKDVRGVGVTGGLPLVAGLALWTGRLFGLPVNGETGRIKALSCFGAALWDQR